MALLVPNIGELDSLRYLINQSNHVADREDNAPRDLVLKLFSSDTTPAENDVPTQAAYYEPYQNDGSFGYGSAIETGYPTCVNNRTEARYDYDSQYGILLNGSRWGITQSGGTTTATYPEQTFTFTGAAGNVYGYYITRANNMPLALQGVLDGATASAGTTITKGEAGAAGTKDCIGLINTNFITVPTTANSASFGGVDDLTIGMIAGGNAAIPANTKVIGIERTTTTDSPYNGHRVYLSANLTANIQDATDPTVEFSFGKVVTDTAHQLQPGDVIYVAGGTSTTGGTVAANTYTVYKVNSSTEFTTTPALLTSGGTAFTGNSDVTLYSAIMYAERFTNGPYEIQNNGDQIKITLNISLD